MPMYTFRNTEDGTEWSTLMKSDELDQFLEDNPQIERALSAPRIVTGISRKPDTGFRDVLKRIKKASGSENTIDTF